MRARIARLALLAALATGPGLARADAPADLKIRPVKGPATVMLAGGLARLEVPAGYLFLKPDDAIHVLRRAGNPTDGTEIGLLHPAAATSRSFIVIEHAAIGHVSDADPLDAGALLASIAQAQRQQNEARRARGQPEITVTGWAEPPAYDRATRRMSWAVKARAGKEELINSRTRLLGRAGYLSYNLITDPAAFAHDSAVVAEVLARSSYHAGHRYEDYQPGKDRAAGRGLSDLVAAAPGAGGATGLARFRGPLLRALGVTAGMALLALILFGRLRRRRVRALGPKV